MFEADAERSHSGETAPEGNTDAAVFLEPLRPSQGSSVGDAPGGTLSFAWRVDTRAREAAYPGRRLRTDFCLRVAGETRGCFIMVALPGDATGVTLSLDEVRLKLGSRYARPARVALRWSLALALSVGGPLFTSRESDFILVPKKGTP